MLQSDALHRLHRRTVLRAGAWGLVNGLIPSSVQAVPETRANAGSCILVYLLGGPPHQDTFDLKPDAPAELRGPFQPIATNVPGIQICEHLPLLSKQMHHFALLRTVTYPNHDHPFMTYYTLTGRVSPVPLGANTVLPPSRKDYPHLGAVVSKFHHRDRSVPGYVAIPEVRVRMGAAPVAGGGRAGFLGPAYDPFPINEDPRKPIASLKLTEGVSESRFEGRQMLLAELEGAGSTKLAKVEHEEFRRSASQLLRSASRDLFSLDREPLRVRERYGQHRFGQSLLLARRLVEAGVSMVAVHFNYMTKCDGWDTHKQNFKCLQGELLPMLDQSLSALIDDLDQRGRLNETLVKCMGEFGRTPKINKAAGRDHWGHCSSVIMAGGGVRGGQVIGASDKIAGYPKDFPIDPADVQASTYHALGMHQEQMMYDQLRRPVPLSRGKVIAQLF